jgi:hypothetical protein
MTAPYLTGAWLPPLYAGHREGPETTNLRPCGCYRDPVPFGHEVLHPAPVACGESGLDSNSSSEKGAA